MDATFEPVLIPATEDIGAACAEHRIQERYDDVAEEINELYQVMHPVEYRSGDAAHRAAFIADAVGDPATTGTWVLYPWAFRAVRVLGKEYFLKLRTARNKLIITDEEQKRYQEGAVGIAGLSVGSSIASILALTGGPNRVRIADFDTLAITNLNRINGSVTGLGVNKAVLCARRIYELNPYAEVEVHTDGITSENIADFVDGLTVLFDEIDDLKMKIDLRLHARDKKVPVVMITDNADNIMIDIERYDQGVSTLFHGRLEEAEAQELFATPEIEPRKRMEATLKIVGAENGTPRMQDSLLEVGRSLPSWPQLGTATTLTGAAGAYIARKIILGEPLFAGRTHLSLDATLIPDYLGPEATAERARHTAQFVDALGRR